MKNLKIISVLVISVVILSSCRKDDILPPANQKPQTMNELVASPSFDWKTTRDYQFTINGFNNGLVKIVSASGVVYHQGFMKANTAYNVKLSLPTYEKSVRLLFWGKDVNCLLSQPAINYTFTNK